MLNLVNKSNTRKFFLLTAALTSFFLLSSLGTENNKAPLEEDSPSYKEEHCRKVYKRITKAIRDARPAPTFNFIYSKDPQDPYYNAYYNPRNNTINFGEGIYDICTTFDADSTNALAMVLAHELAHYYKDHGWGMSFGMANEETEIAKTIYDLELTSDRRAEMEAEADYFGGVFGRMAGYNTVGVGGEFFKRLYKEIDLPDSLFGYPSLQDRISICNNSLDRFERLVPVFRASNLLTVTNNYDQAAVCFHYLADIFPSREMFNNIGVSKAQEALNYYQPEELKYVYPFGLDRETRLDGSNFYVGNKGEETPKEKRQALLEDAVELFEKSISLDAEYAPAVVNLALAKCLLGEEEMGMALAKKALKLTENEKNLMLKANAQIARGLALIHNEKYGEAEDLLKQAIEGNKDFAEDNLEVLKHRTEKKYARLLKKKAKAEAKSEIRPAQVNNEFINEYNMDAISTLADMVKEGSTEENFVITTIQKQNDKRPETMIYNYQEEGLLATSIWQTATWMKGVWGTTYLMTPKDYKGETARGIQLGSKSDEVKKYYGEPDRLLAANNANYYVYQDANDPEKSGLLFIINSKNEVTQWMIYAKTDHPAIVAGN